MARQPASGTFQRLEEVNRIYVREVGVHLKEKAGNALWDQLQQSGAMRHVLTHNAGIVDAKFLRIHPAWHQGLGERIQVGRTDADSFLEALERFADVALSVNGA